MKRFLLALPTLLLLAAPRPLLHAADPDLLITEFLAQNNGGLRDSDGDSADWIEIFNGTSDTVNLAGYYLTDDPLNLTRWTFPSTSLGSASYLIVFASGKDRAVAGQELHANFGLDSDGGYLALVAPDGTNILHDYTYQAQPSNVSFGVGRSGSSTTTLLPANAPTRLLVPTDGTLDQSWTAPDFNDASWLATNAPVGFDAGSQGDVVLAVDFNDRDGSSTTQPGFSTFTIGIADGDAIQDTPTTRTFAGISVTLAGAGPVTGYDDRLRDTPDNSANFTESLLLRDFVFSRDNTGNGGLDVTVGGLAPNQSFTITLWSFDSGSTGNRVADWSANGVVVAENYSFGGQTLPTSNEQYQISFEAFSDPSGQIVLAGRRDSTSQSSGGASDFGVFVNALQITGQAAPPMLEGLASLMLSNNASAYIRSPFNVPDPVAFSSMTLRMRYNDGFVAYLNGQPVASANAPAPAIWNSSALAAHSAALTEDFPFIPPPGLLQTGPNVLAIHGLNIRADDLNFLLNPELLASESGVLPNRFFSPPTPGAPNDDGFIGLVADTKFSADRGFYDTPFTVAITSATANASIYWTTNGSAPSPSNGTLYSGPVPINGTTYLKAAAFKSGQVPSDVDTHTYLFLDEVLQQPANPPGFPTTWQGSYPADYGMDPNVVNSAQYGPALKDDLRSIPTLSLVMPHEDWWNSSSGIYVRATREGPSWERAASAELIGPDGSTEFAVNCGIQMQGNASRDNARTPKHAMRLLFKSDYGPTKLNYDWFPGPVDRHNTIVLRACFTDSWSTRYSDGSSVPPWRGTRYRPEDSLLLRDVWVKDSLRDMGWLSGRSDFVHLYINGLYWGVYNPADRLDEGFFAEHLGGRDEDWDVIRDFSEVLTGSKNDWNQMMNLVNAGVTTESAYQAVANLVDIENLIDFMMIHIFAEAEDWPHHNWYAAHRRANSTFGTPATKWIFLSWDQEIVLDQLVRRNRVNVSNNDTPARIYSQLRAYPEFRRLFGDRIHKHFFNGGALSPEGNTARLQKRVAQIHRAMVGESARWGDAREFAIGANPATGQTFTRDEWWTPELDKLYNDFFPTLTQENVSRFRAANLYPNVDAPSFNQFGGQVPAGFEIVLNHPLQPQGTLFYTLDGTDPREYGTAAVAPSAVAYADPLPVNVPLQVNARVLLGGEWSALLQASFFPPQNFAPLALTEIMYHPPDLGLLNGDEFEFLELKNTGTEILDLSGLTFTSGIDFTFTNGTKLNPGQFFVLGRNPGALRGLYPELTLSGIYTGKLDNAGEQLAISHPLGARLISLTYNDAGRWPITADGLGFSIVPKSTRQNLNSGRPAHWRASTLPGGSPGSDDPDPFLPGVVINEILTHTDPPLLDTIELFNPSSAEVDVSGWFLSDDRRAPRKFRLPPGTLIAAGGYRSFDETDFNPTPGLGNSFSLSSVGEEIHLVAADPAENLLGYSDGFNFGAAANGVSFGRYVVSTGDEHYPAQISRSLDAANLGPIVGPVVVSQIMYHPPDLPSGQDNQFGEYIELHNISNAPVPLFNAAAQPWELRDAVQFVFPPGYSLNPGQSVLIVSFNPDDAPLRTAFETLYPHFAGKPLLGPYSGKLDNSSDRVELIRPDLPNPDGIPEILVERVTYRDDPPWPAAADGTGASLQRISLSEYGNDPVNWMAAAVLAIFGHPRDITLSPGESGSLTVRAAGMGTLLYQWLRDGQPIPGATQDTLVITDASNSDQGHYSVRVTDPTGSLTSQPAFVGVLTPPVFLEPPLAQSVVEGGSITFHVLTSGHLPMGYRWRRSSLTLFAEVIPSNRSSFTIPNVQLEDAGIYTVVATNAAFAVPGVLSPRARLTVLADSDGDKMADDWEIQFGFNPNDPADATLDFDRDGISNRDEHQAGTDPNNPDSAVQLTSIAKSGEPVAMEFLAISNRSYSVLFQNELAGPDGPWQRLIDIFPRATNRLMRVEDQAPAPMSRYYQLVTPIAP